MQAKQVYKKGLLCLCVFSLSVTYAQIPAGYYSSAAGKKDAALLQALHTCIQNHTVINYNALEDYYEPIDFRANGTLWDIYSNCEFTMSHANKPQSDFCDGWNKEHTVPQSWFGEASPMKSDLFHVLPTDARVNNLRSNYPYGETESRNDKVSNGAPYALGHLGSSSFSGFSNIGTVYEPDDKYKGDIARIYFYMVARYLDRALTSANGAKMFTSSGGTTGLTDYSVALLMKWHRQDPVSQKEINRNDSVYKVQKNRNPFVDYPFLAEYIWGNKKGSNLDFSSIISAYDPSFVPDQSDGTGSTTYEKFGVIWLANGTTLAVDSVFENQKPASLPSAPASCSESSNTFVGWSRTPIVNATDTRPSDLFDSLEDCPAIHANVTYHAVFAHMEAQEGEGAVEASATFDSYKRGDVVSSASAGKVSITFAKSSAKNDTKYYSEVRCYPGSKIILSGADMTRIEFVAGTNDKGNPLAPSTGSLNGNVWTGKADNITFSIGGDSGYKGISAIKVTYEDITSLNIYSAYLTSCSGASSEAVNAVMDAPSASKQFINGQLYILVGDELFDIFGRRVR